MKFEYIVAYENSWDQFNNYGAFSDQGEGRCRPSKVHHLHVLQYKLSGPSTYTKFINIFMLE